MTDYNDSQDYPKPNPFVGRENIIARLYQDMFDPRHRNAIVFTGHDGMGKTHLFNYLSQAYDETILALYIPLNNTPLNNEDTWLMFLLQTMQTILEERNFSLSRVPQFENDSNLALRDWFSQIYMPELSNIIRSHRRILWLFDDAEYLLQASANHINYLQQLLQENPQLTIVLSIDTESEDKLNQLSPLVNISHVERISRLNSDESRKLLLQYESSLSEEDIQKIIESAGGHPRLLARYGESIATTRNFQTAKQQVYEASREEFRQIWLKLSRDERLCLTAIASLVYEDPLRPVTPKAIETWLVETDFPMDLIAINAALRGLDYRDIIQHKAGGSIALITGLLQQWLLEHARFDESGDKRSEKLSPRLIIAVIVIIAILIALLFMIPLPLITPENPIPTATLSQ